MHGALCLHDAVFLQVQFLFAQTLESLAQGVFAILQFLLCRVYSALCMRYLGTKCVCRGQLHALILVIFARSSEVRAAPTLECVQMPVPVGQSSPVLTLTRLVRASEDLDSGKVGQLVDGPLPWRLTHS